mgnify:CR=1 FL=1
MAAPPGINPMTLIVISMLLLILTPLVSISRPETATPATPTTFPAILYAFALPAAAANPFLYPCTPTTNFPEGSFSRSFVDLIVPLASIHHLSFATRNGSCLRRS